MPNQPLIIDVFSGVGGLSLGAVKAGFHLQAAVEREKRILDSHALNFPSSIHLCEDIFSLTGSSLIKKIDLKGKELSGVIGGPPCQGFSTMGKRNVDDARNQLFLKFFRLVSELHPVFFVAENVPGILNEQYEDIRKSATKIVEKKYTLLKPIKVCAKDFGAATTRTRIFFIGIRKDLKSSDFERAISQVQIEQGTTVKNAVINLPIKISEDWNDSISSWQKIEIQNSNKYLTSINKIIDGVGDKTSITRYLKKKEVSGCFGTKHTKEVLKRFKSLKQGEQDSVSKSVRLNENGFCPTLRAGTDSTKGSFQAVRPIHFSENRVITPREAARLQGFPDWFQFHSTKWHSFRQIGNSVCPIAAEKVLSLLKEHISM